MRACLLPFLATCALACVSLAITTAIVTCAVYCIPSDADYVLRIDPQTCSATEIGPEIGTRATHCHISHNCNKWQNGFLARDGQPEPEPRPRAPDS